MGEADSAGAARTLLQSNAAPGQPGLADLLLSLEEGESRR